MKPIRIQRKRVKGFDLQKLSKSINGLPAVSVTRPGKWGNPFKGKDAVKKFKECLLYPHMTYYYFDEIEATTQFKRFTCMNIDLPMIRLRNLACFCPLDKECHADVLLEFANQ